MKLKYKQLSNQGGMNFPLKIYLILIKYDQELKDYLPFKEMTLGNILIEDFFGENAFSLKSDWANTYLQ